MKRLWILLLAAAMLLSVAACENKTEKKPSSSASEAPTDAPYIDTQLDEPEWTLAEGKLQLEDGEKICAGSDAILYFGIVTKADGSKELRFMLDDAAAAALKTESADKTYFMTLDGVKIGDAELNEDCTQAIITEDNAAGEITTIATKIRGV